LATAAGLGRSFSEMVVTATWTSCSSESAAS
jgi:hypothetical protein